MGNRYAAGRIAIAECDRCGFRYKLSELKKLVVKGKIVSTKVCPSCFDPDHPQLRLGMTPVSDPQAIREPRPDFSGYAQSRAIIQPVYPVVGTVFAGLVSVTTS